LVDIVNFADKKFVQRFSIGAKCHVGPTVIIADTTVNMNHQHLTGLDVKILVLKCLLYVLYFNRFHQIKILKQNLTIETQS